MNYTDYVATIANLIPTTTTDVNFVQILPSIINDAEQRIYRELDLLTTVTRDETGVLTPNSRLFVLPQHFVVTSSISVYTPAGTNTTANQLVPVSQEWMDAVWGGGTPALPQYYAMLTDQQILVAPFPDAAYKVEVTGTIRPAPLSASNSTTYISLYLVDLFISASMVFASGFMKNFGAATDDPQMPASWESHYQREFTSANTEENRKKYAAQGWTSKNPSSISTPPRT
jgi:hypothetical protein